MGSYKDLVVWQKSIQLTKEIYRLIGLLPKEETYSLSDQMRRAVVSMSSNIAEGQARKNDKEFIQFLHIAKGSMAELETQLITCREVGYFSQEQLDYSFNLCQQITVLLNNLISKIKGRTIA